VGILEASRRTRGKTRQVLDQGKHTPSRGEYKGKPAPGPRKKVVTVSWNQLKRVYTNETSPLSAVPKMSDQKDGGKKRGGVGLQSHHAQGL